MLGINMISCAEGLNFGMKLGMDAKVLREICCVSTSSSFNMTTYNPVPGLVETSPANRDWEGGFGVALIKKDMALALDEAQTVEDLNVDMSRFATEYYDHLERKGFGTKDYGFVYPYIEQNKKI